MTDEKSCGCKGNCACAENFELSARLKTNLEQNEPIIFLSFNASKRTYLGQLCFWFQYQFNRCLKS